MVRKSVVGEKGVTLTVEENVTIKLMDNSKNFDDVAEEDWYWGAVAFVSSRELFSGVSEAIFAPNATMSRAMLSQVLYNLEGNPGVNASATFTDVVENSWYAAAVEWAAGNGIVGGYGDGIFGPGNSITREQLAVILWRYVGSPVAESNELNFPDARETSEWAVEAMLWATENGIINGYENGMLAPGSIATRAEVAAILMQFFQTLAK